MTISNFEIQLDNPSSSYFAGQAISGIVIVEIDEKPKTIHGIKLKLQGKAKTHWKEATSNRGAMTHYSDEESYVQDKTYLAGYDESTPGNTFTLVPGRYTYNFRFPLPENLPSSLTHKHGQVKYYLEATISRGHGIAKPNFTVRLPFTVNAILDLNNEYGSNHESVATKEKFVCCWICKSGPVGFDFKIFKSGFVPGEVVKFYAELQNYSSREVKTVVDLVQEMKFHAMGRTKNKSICLTSLAGPRLKPNETKIWRSDDAEDIDLGYYSLLRIPSVPPSRLDGCRIIEVAYYIKVKMDVKDAVTLKDYIPITIGTIPLRENFAELGGGEVGIEVASDLTSVIINYPDLPPPTYQEAINYSEPLEEEDPPDYYDFMDTNTKYVPMYVTYSPRIEHLQK